MKLSASLLIFCFLFYSVLGEDVIDNKVSTRRGISTLEITSTKYNISNLELSLVSEQDELMGSFVVSPQADDVKAFGYIEDGRFFGQFTSDGRTFLLEAAPPGQEGGKLVAWDQLTGVGDKGRVLKDEIIIPDGAHAQSGRPATDGNVCRMRIIIDEFLLQLFDNNKKKLKSLVKLYELSLNDIYKEGGVSVRVNNRNLPLKFRVVDLQFHDEAYCRRHGFSPVSCKKWRSHEQDTMLETHAATDHSDVCLSYLFTSHDFNGILGVAYISGICQNYARLINPRSGVKRFLSQNTGFVTFSGNSLSSSPILTFAHEVGHNLGAEHDGDTNTCNPSRYMMASYAEQLPMDHSKIFSSCSKNYFRFELENLVKDPTRKCLVMEDQLRSGFDTSTVYEDEDSTPATPADPSTTTYISVGVSVVLVLIIALLLFCLMSKRDLSPCPNRSDFGRRYTQVRRRLSRSWTLGKSGREQRQFSQPSAGKLEIPTTRQPYAKFQQPSRTPPALPINPGVAARPVLPRR